MNQKWEGGRDKTWWEQGNGIGLRVNFLVCSGRLFFGFGIGKLASTYTHIHNWSLLPAYLLCGSRLFRLVQSFSLYFPLWILFFFLQALLLYISCSLYLPDSCLYYRVYVPPNHIVAKSLANWKKRKRKNARKGFGEAFVVKGASLAESTYEVILSVFSRVLFHIHLMLLGLWF